jgi:hypothetical protein
MLGVMKNHSKALLRTLFRSVAVLAVALGLSSALAVPASAAVPSGPYYVRNLGTGLCLDAFYSGGGVDGNPVGLWECNNGITEQWLLWTNSSSTEYPYRLVNVRSYLCLDYEAASGGEPGWRFKLWNCNGSAAQNLSYNLNDRFQVQSSKRGSYNGMIMDAYASGGGGNGNPVGIWPYTGSPLQQWRLDRA